MCGQSTLDVSAVDEVLRESGEKLDIVLPDNLELRTDRVGNYVTYGDEVRVGETVRFTYSGGSEVGPRTVLVVKVDNNGLEGLTLERDGGYRRYDDGQINGDIQIVEPFINSHVGSTSEKRVRFDDAGIALLASLSGEQLAELYGKYVSVDGVGTEFDGSTGEVVVKLPEPSNSMKAIVGEGDYRIEVVNTSGEKLDLFLYENGQLGIYNSQNGFNEGEVTVEQLRDQLVEFLA